MDTTDPHRDAAAAADLFAAASACPDPRLRGAILALASIYDGVGFAEAARLWNVDPKTLSDVWRRFEDSGIEGLSGDCGGGARRQP